MKVKPRTSAGTFKEETLFWLLWKTNEMRGWAVAGESFCLSKKQT
jgi:hypothetical protein